MISKVIIFLTLFAVWILLSWPVEIKDIVFGLLVSSFVTFMTVDLMRGAGARRARSVTIARRFEQAAWVVYYMVVFLWECLKANIDVAYRVLHPDLPIEPGTVRVRVTSTSYIGLTFLANSVTLTPGTTSVDVSKEKGILYVHLLSMKEVEARRKVIARFDRILKKIFE